jgi:hypothetical protein
MSKKVCKCATLIHLDGLKSSGKFHPHTAVNYIRNTQKPIAEYLQEGVTVNFSIVNIHFFHNWKRLASDPTIAIHILIETNKIDPSLYCNAFRDVLDYCHVALTTRHKPIFRHKIGKTQAFWNRLPKGDAI